MCVSKQHRELHVSLYADDAAFGVTYAQVYVCRGPDLIHVQSRGVTRTIYVCYTTGVFNLF